METLAPEKLNLDTQLARARHELAVANGFDISDTPVELSEEQQSVLRADFSTPPELKKLASSEVKYSHAHHGETVRRFDSHALTKVAGVAETDEVITLIKPIDKRTTEKKSAALAACALAVDTASRLLGVPEGQLDQHLETAEVNVYASPYNGAPLLTERTIRLPRGSIYEMHLHGAGSPEVIDTQVIVAPPAAV